MQHPEEHAQMALVRLKRAAQITIPAELRKRFHLEEGDYLEAEAVEDGILLKTGLSHQASEGLGARARSPGPRACEAAAQWQDASGARRGNHTRDQRTAPGR